jgi:uncharacterized protein
MVEAPTQPLAVNPVISCYQARTLLEARRLGLGEARSSLDLGQSERVFELDTRGAHTGPELCLEWGELERVADNDSVCFELAGGELAPLRMYSHEAERAFQLWPTERAPALLISGFLMHRIRDATPEAAASAMVRPLGKVRGRLLDTTSGLGYAAIAASRVASEVVTIELEPVVRELARKNPWSRELFDNPRIGLREGDSARLIDELPAESFAAVLHDPPAINLAGELYAGEFYARVRRLLARNGRLFHYIGDPHSASGSRTTRGVIKRLREAGFGRVTMVPEAFGVIATL